MSSLQSCTILLVLLAILELEVPLALITIDEAQRCVAPLAAAGHRTLPRHCPHEYERYEFSLLQQHQNFLDIGDRAPQFPFMPKQSGGTSFNRLRTELEALNLLLS